MITCCHSASRLIPFDTDAAALIAGALLLLLLLVAHISKFGCRFSAFEMKSMLLPFPHMGSKFSLR